MAKHFSVTEKFSPQNWIICNGIITLIVVQGSQDMLRPVVRNNYGTRTCTKANCHFLIGKMTFLFLNFKSQIWEENEDDFGVISSFQKEHIL